MSTIFTNMPLLFLSCLVGAALFLLMAGLRQLREDRPEGALFIALGVFFFAAHFFYLLGIPDSTQVGSAANLTMAWYWLTELFAPALIALYLLVGVYNFLITQVKLGATKIFFGLSLSAFLYWVGLGWAVDIRGILTIVWTVIWFDVELETAS